MNKYISKELANFIKQDAKIIKKYHPNEKNAVIQNELAKFFGWRHFKELEINIKNNDFNSFTVLNELTPEKLEGVISRYNNEIIKSYSEFNHTELENEIKEIEKKIKSPKYNVKSIESFNEMLSEKAQYCFKMWLESKDERKTLLNVYLRNLERTGINTLIESVSSYKGWVKEMLSIYPDIKTLSKVNLIKPTVTMKIRNADLFVAEPEDFIVDFDECSLLLSNSTMKEIIKTSFENQIKHEYMKEENIGKVRLLVNGLFEIAENSDNYFIHKTIFEIKDLEKLKELNEKHNNKNIEKYLKNIKDENEVYVNLVTPYAFRLHCNIYDPTKKIIKEEEIISDQINLFIKVNLSLIPYPKEVSDLIKGFVLGEKKYIKDFV